MDLPINPKTPAIMFVDLNSCFASAEQQANHLLRGKPIAVAAYNSPRGCIIAPSIEAKKVGIKVGMRVGEAKKIEPNIIIRTPDPPKYRDIHLKFKKIFESYSPKVIPKSIDEAIIDFNSHPQTIKKNLLNIAKEIKTRIKKEVGDWLLCNIGISTNIFLAKLGSSMDKPNGLNVITNKNLLDIYQKVKLTDLHGINIKFQTRLNYHNIFTPLDFFQTPAHILKAQIFKSICGVHWFYRLRGWEVDDIEFATKSFGQSYSLYKQTEDKKTLSHMILKLCEKMGRRLRKNKYQARGIHLSLLYFDRTFWHQSKTFKQTFSSTHDLYLKTMLIFNNQPKNKKVANISVSCINLVKKNTSQLALFETNLSKASKLSKALDKINDKYGEFTAIPANLIHTKNIIVDRIAFGNVKNIN